MDLNYRTELLPPDYFKIGDDLFVLDEEEYNHEKDMILPEGWMDYYIEDLQILAKDYIERFFRGKELSIGGQITKQMMHSEHYVTLVLNTNIESGVQKAYESLEYYGKIQTHSSNEGIVTEDVKLVVAIMDKCAKLGIPKSSAVGILLMYLELCLGVEIS